MASEMTSSEVISNANIADAWHTRILSSPAATGARACPGRSAACTVTGHKHDKHTLHNKATKTRKEHHTSQEVALKVSALNSITSQLSHHSMLAKRGVNLQHWQPAAIDFFRWAIAAASRATMPSWPPYSLTSIHMQKHVTLGPRTVLQLNQTRYLSCQTQQNKEVCTLNQTSNFHLEAFHLLIFVLRLRKRQRSIFSCNHLGAALECSSKIEVMSKRPCSLPSKPQFSRIGRWTSKAR